MKVLVALDDSEFSRRALDAVRERPWPDDTEIVVVSVVELRKDEFEGWHVENLPDMSDYQREFVEETERLVEKAVVDLKESLPSAAVRGKVLQGRAKEAVLIEAEHFRPDLIVLGSHGRRGVKKLVLGSVAESILYNAFCPVEIVKSPGTTSEDDKVEPSAAQLRA